MLQNGWLFSLTMAHMIIEKPINPGKTTQRMYIPRLHSLHCTYLCLIGLQPHREAQCILSFLLIVNKFNKLIHTLFKIQSLTHKPHQRINTSSFIYTSKQFQFQEINDIKILLFAHNHTIVADSEGALQICIHKLETI